MVENLLCSDYPLDGCSAIANPFHDERKLKDISLRWIFKFIHIFIYLLIYSFIYCGCRPARTHTPNSRATFGSPGDKLKSLGLASITFYLISPGTDTKWVYFNTEHF